MKKIVFFTLGILTALVTVVAGFVSCDQTSASVGRLIVNITDAPSAPEIDQVWLTITGVQVHVAGSEDTEEESEDENGGEWKDLPLVGAVDGELKFDLLKFIDGSQEKVAVGFLDPGKYTQLRMDVELVELHIADEGELVFHVAKLPSDVLKFVHPFEIANGADTELLFDFDALKSVVVTGKDTYIFKPVVKVTTINQPFQITTLSLPNGVVGSYTAPALATTGGVAPYTWSLDAITPVVVGNSLSIDPATGAISGTFAVAGDYTLRVKVIDGSAPQLSTTKDFDIEIAASGALQIITTSLPDGTEDVAYPPYVLVAANVNGAYSWTSADLPTGLSLSSLGEISGMITEPGDYSFTVTLTDTVATDNQVIIIRINEAP